MTLRDGVRWHDGEPLTARDVAFTFDYFRDHPGPGRYGHHVFNIPPYESSEVVDDRTVVLRFSGPAPSFELLPGGDLPILPRHVWADVEDPYEATDLQPVGSGPYRVAEIVPDQLYRLEAHEDYFMGAPLVDAIDLPIVPDPTAAFGALRAGEVDAVDRGVPPQLVEEFSDLQGVGLLKGTRLESVQLHFNATKAPPTTSVCDVRSAWRSTRPHWSTRSWSGAASRGWTPSSTRSPRGRCPERRPASTATGRRRSSTAPGSPRPERGGVRTNADGQPLALTVLVAAVAPLHLRAAQVVAEQVASVGVGLTVEAIDPIALRQRRNSGEFDAFVTNLESHAHADPDGLLFFFTGVGIQGPVFGGYDDPQFNRLAQQAAATVDAGERTERLHELQRRFAEAAPAVALFYPDGLYAFRPAAYDGWISDPGHGHLTKRSFPPGYAG